MKFKNALNDKKTKERQKQMRKEQWDAFSADDRQIILKAFADHLCGGDMDEAEQHIEENFIGRGFPSVAFFNEIIQLERDGKPYILIGG